MCPHRWALASGDFCGWVLPRGCASLWVDEKVSKLSCFIESVTSCCRGIYPNSHEVPWSKTGPFPMSAAWNKLPYTRRRLIALNLTEHVFLPFGWMELLGHGCFCRLFISVPIEWCAGFQVVLFYSLCFIVCDVDLVCSASGGGHVLHRGWNTRRVNPCISLRPWLPSDVSSRTRQWGLSCHRALNIHNGPSSRPRATFMTPRLTLVLLPFPPNPF